MIYFPKNAFVLCQFCSQLQKNRNNPNVLQLTNEETVVHSYNKTPHNHKKERNTDTHNMIIKCMIKNAFKRPHIVLLLFIWNFRKGKTVVIASTSVVSWGQEVGMEFDRKTARGKFGAEGCVLKRDCDGSCMMTHLLKFIHS